MAQYVVECQHGENFILPYWNELSSLTGWTKAGYTMVGWSTSPNDTIAHLSCGQPVQITEQISYYAVWKQNTGITPDSDQSNISEINSPENNPNEEDVDKSNING